MEKIVEPLAYLILAILGLIIPIGAIVLSLFSRGFTKLSQQYQAESVQTRTKLTDQLKKAGETESVDDKQILQTIKELKKLKRTAESKLRLLSPKKAILYLAVPLIVAFLTVLPMLIYESTYAYALLVVSLLGVAFALQQFWKLLGIIVETTEIIERDAKDEQRRIPELLAQIASGVKDGSKYFVDKVFVSFLGVELKKDVNEVALKANNKIEIPISFTNSEARMAKDVELGFRFPLEFLVEKKSSYSIYTAEDEQIVRYSTDRLHGNTTLKLLPLVITPLKVGDYKIKTFIKGENIETKNRTLKISIQ